MRIAVFIILLGICLNAYSQSFHYQGAVIELESLNPISKVRIVDAEGRFVAVTMDDGRFSFRHESPSLMLSLSHLGYKGKQFQCYGNSTETEIYMEPGPTRLEEVLIRGQGPRNLLPDPKIYVLDYEPLTDSLLCVTYNPHTRQNQLIITSLDGEVIIDTIQTPESPGHIFRDCFGRLQVAGKDYVSHLVLRPGMPLFFSRDKDTHLPLLKACLHSIDSLIFLENRHNQQTTEYYGISLFNSQRVSLIGLQDYPKLKIMAEEGLLLSPENGMKKYLSNTYDLSPGRLVEIQFMEKILLKPIATDLIGNGAEIMVADFSRKKLYAFSSPYELPQVRQISFPEGKGWIPQIINDPVSKTLYMLRKVAGYYDLYRLETDTGKLSHQYSIRTAWVNNIKIRNSRLYYLHKEVNYEDINRLFAVDL